LHVSPIGVSVPIGDQLNATLDTVRKRVARRLCDKEEVAREVSRKRHGGRDVLLTLCEVRKSLSNSKGALLKELQFIW